MTTPILNINEVANNQVNQYLTVNEAIRALESSTNQVVSVDLSSGDATITNTSPDYNFSRNAVFKAVGNSSARVLTVPSSQRLFIVWNSGSASLTVKRGASEINVKGGSSSLFYTDGSLDGLIGIAGGGSGTLSIVSESSTSRVMSVSDSGSWVRFTNSGVVTAEIPPESSEPWSPGDTLYFRQAGSGTLEIVPGSGVSIIPPAGGTLMLSGQGAAAGAVYVGGDVWELNGQMEEAP